jgi:hypothetical protein
MAPSDGETVLCTSYLSQLADDLQSSALANTYADMFLGLLPGRVQRILASLRARDTPAALDAALSLKVNSHMVGALTMERTCRTLERRLLDGDTAAAARTARDLATHSGALAQALTEYLS